MNHSDLPLIIPIFPLSGALLLPRTRLPLHIFEPRYIAMLENCMKSPQRLIGMVQTTGPDGKRLASIGCAGRLTSFSETEDGRYMVTLTGTSRFRIGEEVEGFTPFRRFSVDWQGFSRDRSDEDERDPGLDRTAFLDLLSRFFEVRNLGVDWQNLSKAEPELLINALSMLLPLPPEDKQALLEAPNLTDRRQTLTALIQFALHRGDDGDEMMQ
jgi:Lon protease-like protein